MLSSRLGGRYNLIHRQPGARSITTETETSGRETALDLSVEIAGVKLANPLMTARADSFLRRGLAGGRPARGAPTGIPPKVVVGPPLDTPKGHRPNHIRQTRFGLPGAPHRIQSLQTPCEGRGERGDPGRRLVLRSEATSQSSEAPRSEMSAMKQPLIFDGRGPYDLQWTRELGFDYFIIGRSAVWAADPQQ